jgi:hypothetical protein
MSNLLHQLRGKRYINSKIYEEILAMGFDYILNPNTQELHRVGSDKFRGPHNLILANLEDFIGIVNIEVEIHKFPDGVPLTIYDLNTGDLIGKYVINKCRHCFPSKF